SGRFDLAALFRCMAGGGHDERDPPAHTLWQDRHGSFRRREIDEYIDAAGNGQVGAHRDVQMADAGQLADILAELRMPWRFQGRANGQVLVLLGELYDPLPHPAANAVDPDDG